MLMIAKLNYKKFTWILGKGGDLLEEYTIPKHVLDWYEEIQIIDEGYLVMDDNGIYGFLHCLDFNHQGQDDEDERMEALKDKRLREEIVLQTLRETASKMENHIKPYSIYIGNATGTNSRHEFCVFFPSGHTPKHIDSQIKWVESKIHAKYGTWLDDREETMKEKIKSIERTISLDHSINRFFGEVELIVFSEKGNDYDVFFDFNQLTDMMYCYGHIQDQLEKIAVEHQVNLALNFRIDRFTWIRNES
jgi:hypothetical protein